MHLTTPCCIGNAANTVLCLCLLLFPAVCAAFCIHEGHCCSIAHMPTLMCVVLWRSLQHVNLQKQCLIALQYLKEGLQASSFQESCDHSCLSCSRSCCDDSIWRWLGSYECLHHQHAVRRCKIGPTLRQNLHLREYKVSHEKSSGTANCQTVGHLSNRQQLA